MVYCYIGAAVGAGIHIFANALRHAPPLSSIILVHHNSQIYLLY